MPVRSFLAIVSWGLLLTTAAVFGNWPSFRGAAGGSTGSPPATWDIAKGANIAWRTAIPDLGHSSPIVWGNRVYVTTAVSSTGDDQL